MFARVVERDQAGALLGPEAAARYAEMAEGFMMQYRGFLRDLETLDVGNRYLEIGPGPGILATAIARERPDVQITGVEMSPDMAVVARGVVERADLANRIRFLVGDAGDRNSLASLDQFDLIYSSFSLHPWADPKGVVHKLMSALADGGVLYIYDLRRVWWLYWVPARNGFLNSIRAAYVSRELREMLRDLETERYEIRNVFPFMQSVVIRK